MNDVIQGQVLDLMYETNREAFVFKYLDLNSNEIEFISVEELCTCNLEQTQQGIQNGLIYCFVNMMV